MKVELKDGTKIECTMQEFIELKKQDLINGTQPEKQKPIKNIIDTKQLQISTQLGTGHILVWNKLEDSVITEFYTNRKRGKKLKGPEYRKLCSLLPNRTKLQIGKRAAELGLTKIIGNLPKSYISLKITSMEQEEKPKAHKKEVKPRKHYNIKPSVLENRRERFNFMNKRANYYMKTYNWGREKAYIQAGEDYRNGCGLEKHHTTIVETMPPKIKAKFVLDFPKFNYLTDDGNALLESMIKNVIGIQGTINYKDMMFIGLDGEVWSVGKWKQFVGDFMKSAEIICDYFSVPNKFVINMGDTGYITIKYGGKDV